jgi:shikimate dehydrogenase
VVWSLMSQGTSVTVSGRNVLSGRRLASDLMASRHHARGAAGTVAFVPDEPAAIAAAIEQADLLVNATPVGAWPPAGPPSAPDRALPRSMTVFDLVYRPRRTRLLQLAERCGCVVVEGVEMLVEQATRSFAMWVGCEPPIDVIRESAYRALETPALAGSARAEAEGTAS